MYRGGVSPRGIRAKVLIRALAAVLEGLVDEDEDWSYVVHPLTPDVMSKPVSTKETVIFICLIRYTAGWVTSSIVLSIVHRSYRTHRNHSGVILTNGVITSFSVSHLFKRHQSESTPHDQTRRADLPHLSCNRCLSPRFS